MYPGGTASYPSSVLMNAIPSKVAGVKRRVITVPSLNGEINPMVLAAADIAGCHRGVPDRRSSSDCGFGLWDELNSSSR
jgi:hypothetical protein